MLPQEVREILTTLEEAGFAAFAVGGCVRDSLLGRTPDDWDLTTSARPEQVMALFAPHAIPTGLQHGTVTVRRGGSRYRLCSGRADRVVTLDGAPVDGEWVCLADDGGDHTARFPARRDGSAAPKPSCDDKGQPQKA